MTLFRIGQRWSNDRIALAAGKVYELTDDEAAEVGKDCPGAVVPLSDDATDRLREVLDSIGIGCLSLRPGLPDKTGHGRGPVEVMDRASMSALVKPKGR